MTELVRYVILDQNNMIIETGIGREGDLPPNAIGIGWSDMPPNPFDYELQEYSYEENGEILTGYNWIQRPAQLQFEEITSNSWRVVNCPPNTLFKVVDIEGEEVLIDQTVDGLLEFEIVDGGTYQLDLVPPLPQLPTYRIFNVNN